MNPRERRLLLQAEKLLQKAHEKLKDEEKQRVFEVMLKLEEVVDWALN